jgi:hypothetical protein
MIKLNLAPASTPPASRTPDVRGKPIPRRRSWLLVISLLFPVVLVGVAAFFYIEVRAADTISLEAREREGILRFTWNGQSRPFFQAKSGRIEIIDGDDKRSYPLTDAELQRGFFPVIRRNADVTARLVLNYGNSGREEIMRYLGHPVAVHDNPPKPVLEQLLKENDELRRVMLIEKARADDLQHRVDVLEAFMERRDGRR